MLSVLSVSQIIVFCVPECGGAAVLGRPKSVPSSPMVVRAFSRLGSITAGWGRPSKKAPDPSRLRPDDRKKWASSHDCSGQTGGH